MNTKALIAEIDTEIAKLQTARTALLTIGSAPVKSKRGRPKGSTNKTAAAPKKRRKMSAEARAKIAAAQKRRWATAKKSA